MKFTKRETRYYRDEDIGLDIRIQIHRADEVKEHFIEEDGIKQWLENVAETDTKPFIQISSDENVRVGETVLEMYQNDVVPLSPPSADEFRLYCLDQSTANTLNIVASNVASGEPCLLEGETATSKTSIIQFLAHLIKQPVIR